MSRNVPATRPDDAASEIGEDMFTSVPPVPQTGSESGQLPTTSIGVGAGMGMGGQQGQLRAMERDAPVSTTVGWGRGPIPIDRRKYRYDILRGRSSPALPFTASRADRMDPEEAGGVLHRIHQMYGIDRAEEARLVAFDKALFFEHTINGASLLQPGRGYLTVDGVQFDVLPFKRLLGVEQRRFFRAFADDILAVNREVLDSYDAYDPVSSEKVGQLHQLSAERGLQKFPYLVHDSSDAALMLTYDERAAVMNSKRIVLESTVNQADSLLAARTMGSKSSSESGAQVIGGS